MVKLNHRSRPPSSWIKNWVGPTNRGPFELFRAASEATEAGEDMDHGVVTTVVVDAVEASSPTWGGETGPPEGTVLLLTIRPCKKV